METKILYVFGQNGDGQYQHHGLKSLPKQILNYINNTVFIDGGAYIGDSAAIFQLYNAQKVISFDLVPQHIVKYKNNMELLNIDPLKYEIIQKGLSDHSHTLKFRFDGSGSNIFASFGEDVEMITLDSVMQSYYDDVEVQQNRVGFIKFDLEGAGFDALVGSLELLKRDRPVVSIAIYHSPIEFFKVKKVLNTVFGDSYTYKIEKHDYSESYYIEINIVAYPKL